MVDPIGGQKRVSSMDFAFVRSKIDGPAAQFLLEKVTKKAATPTHPAAAADLLILGAIGSSQPRNKSRNPLTTDPRIGRARLGFPLRCANTLDYTTTEKKNFPDMSF